MLGCGGFSSPGVGQGSQHWGQGPGQAALRLSEEKERWLAHLQPPAQPQIPIAPILQPRQSSEAAAGSGRPREMAGTRGVSEVVTGWPALSSLTPYQCSSCVLSGFGSRLLLYFRDVCSFTQPGSVYGTSAICGKSVCSFNHANKRTSY